MNTARVATTDAEIDAAIARAAKQDDGLLIEDASYNRALDALVLRLRNGRRVLFPREDLEGLRGAPAAKGFDPRGCAARLPPPPSAP